MTNQINPIILDFPDISVSVNGRHRNVR
jgi:hypothetical protein